MNRGTHHRGFRMQCAAFLPIAVFMLCFPGLTLAQVPAAPTLITPDDGVNPLCPVNGKYKFKWSHASGTTGYGMAFCYDAAFTRQAFVSGGQSTSDSVFFFAGDFIPDSQYYWRVCVTNASGTSPYSAGRSFKTVAPCTEALTLLTPTYAAINAPLNETLIWNAATSSVYNYSAQLSTDSNFPAVSITKNYSTATGINAKNNNSWNLAATGLVNAKRYFWRVRINNGCELGPWSAVSCFTTIPPLCAVPALVQPAQMDTVVNPALFKWSKVTYAASYHIQVSSSSTYSTSVPMAVNDSGVVDTFRTISGLQKGVVYHWRVWADNAAGSGVISNSRQFISMAEPPAGPVLLSPANAATGVEPSPVTFTWFRVLGISTYQLQYSTTSDFAVVTSGADITDTVKTVSGLAPMQTYYWRVKCVNAAGSGAWSSASSFSTTIAGPVLSTPPDGVGGVAVAVSFTWGAMTGATSYTMEYATNSGMTSPTSSTVTTPSCTKTLAYSTTYYWRVKSLAGAVPSAWSSVYSFTTEALPPAQPVLSWPTNGTINIPLTTTLSWNPCASATSYQLQVDTSSAFTSPILQNFPSVAGNSQSVNVAFNNKRYYWRVNAMVGSPTPWSTTWNYTTVPIGPAYFTCDVPAHNATSVGTPVTLKWHPSVGAVTYRIGVCTNPTSMGCYWTGTTLANNITDTFLTVTTLSSNTTYGWWVIAYNSGGSINSPEPQTFTTSAAPPAAPTLSSPADGVTNVATNASLSWGAVSGATSYDVQVATDPDFISRITNQTGITATSVAAGSLSAGALYYWRARTYTATAGTSAWSTVRSFITALATPSLGSPANLATGVSQWPTLSWSGVINATGYYVLVASEPTFHSLVYNGQTASTSAVIANLLSNTTYYWKVVSCNNTTVSNPSEERSFTTSIVIVGTPPAPVTLTAPAYDSSATPLSLTLTWTASSGATSYNTQLDTSEDFTAPIATNGLGTTSMTISSLANGTTYWWRVQAVNASGPGIWSAPYKFSTALSTPVLIAPASDALDMSEFPAFTWNAVHGATGYTLTYSSSPSDTMHLYANTDTTAVIAGRLSNSTVYFWNVDADEIHGRSVSSPVRSFTTVAPPATPQVLAAASGNAQVTLRWSRNSDADFLRYRIYGGTATDPTAAVDSVAVATDTVKVLSGLANGTTYYYRLKAVDNVLTESSYSNEVSATPDGTAPATPVLIAAVAGNTTVTLRWNKNTDPDFLRYRIYCGTAVIPMSVFDSVSTATDTVKTLAGFVNGMAYQFRLTALDNLMNESPFSNEMSATPQRIVTCTPGAARISLGAVAAGLSRDSVIILTNTGNDTLTITSAVSSKTAFTSALSGLKAAPGATLFDTLRFSPGGIGADSAYVVILSNAATSPDTIRVSGTGTGSVFTCTPRSYSLGVVRIGLFKDVAVAVINSGNDTLRITGVTSTDTVFKARTLAFTVAPGDTFIDTVRYRPIAMAHDTARIIFATNMFGKALDTVMVNGIGDFSTGVISMMRRPMVYSFSVAKTPSAKGLRFNYALPQQSTVRLELLDLRGRLVAMPANGVFGPAYYSIPLTGLNTGIYMCRFEAVAVDGAKKGIKKKFSIMYLR